jgi:MFS family permease
VRDEGAGRRGRAGRAARAALVDTSSITSDPAFRRLWLGQLVSELGRQVVIIAMPFEIYIRTQSTLAIGALAAVELVSIFGLSLPAGALVDSMDRRRLLLATQTTLLITTLVLLATALLPDLPLLLVYACGLALSAMTAIDRPARKAALFSIVRPELMNSAVAVDQAANQVGSVLGPAIGGALIGVGGLAAAFAAAGLGFGFMLVSLAGLRTPLARNLGGVRRVQGMRDGLAFVLGHPAVLSTMAIDFTAMVFGFPSALFPVLAVSVYHVGAPGLGLLAGAPAAGALVASLLSGAVTAIRRKGMAIIGFVVLWGFAIACVGLLSFSFPLALAFLAIAGACDIAAAVLRASIVQKVTPDAMRGRVASINYIAVSGGPRLGDVEATAVASLTSVGFSIFTGGLLCVAGTLLVASRFPALRHYIERPPEAGRAAVAT